MLLAIIALSLLKLSLSQYSVGPDIYHGYNHAGSVHISGHMGPVRIIPVAASAYQSHVPYHHVINHEAPVYHVQTAPIAVHPVPVATYHVDDPGIIPVYGEPVIHYAELAFHPDANLNHLDHRMIEEIPVEDSGEIRRARQNLISEDDESQRGQDGSDGRNSGSQPGQQDWHRFANRWSQHGQQHGQQHAMFAGHHPGGRPGVLLGAQPGQDGSDGRPGGSQPGGGGGGKEDRSQHGRSFLV